MSRSFGRRVVVGLGVVLASITWPRCTSFQPQLVLGPSVIGNEPPTLEILVPAASFSINRGERFALRWSDSDPDSAATISFFLQSVDTGEEIPLISDIAENDSEAPDSFNVGTSLVPFGAYYIRGEITDGENTFSTIALVEGATSARVVVTVGEPGTNPLNVPPRVAVVAPAFNLGVAQDDTLNIIVQPSAAAVNEAVPYDQDSDTELFVLLDLDNDPENDDPQLPDASQIIVLREVELPVGEFLDRTFSISVDLNLIPPRTDGLPYFIRATIIDESNPPVHAYAAGTINILRSATGRVDVGQVGATLSGARFVGFNPGSQLGSRMISVGDFDADGVDDFLLVAKFGNPRNFGNIGEAYLVYGLPQTRFGGQINVNSVSKTVPGVIFEGPPNRLEEFHLTDPLARPRGITGATSIGDLTGDGRPELLLSMALVDGLYQGRDDDPQDSSGEQAVGISIQEDFVRRELNENPDTTLDDEFRGTIDTYVDRLNPTTSFGAASTLRLSATAVVDEENPADQFVIVGYSAGSILGVFTTLNPDNISNLTATLELRSVPGADLPAPDDFTVHQLTQPVSENVVYSDFGRDGVPGPTADTEYDGAELDVTINFLNGTMQVEVTETIQALIDGELGIAPAWIFVPAQATDAQFISSEGTSGFRPNLTIEYDETLEDLPNTGCYPDPFTNNLSDDPDDPDILTVDSTFEAGGIVFIVNSENRDTDPLLSEAPRLTNTSIALELVGQEEVGPGIEPLDFLSFRFDEDFLGLESGQIGGTIRHLAGTADAPIIQGVRITAGWWEYVNNGNFGAADVRSDYFGEHVASMPDINNDGEPEIIISSPRNERYFTDLNLLEFADFTIALSTAYFGSITVIAGRDHSAGSAGSGLIDSENNVSIPGRASFARGTCGDNPIARDGPLRPVDGFEIFAEDVADFLGGAEYAGDVNLDGVPDIICGAPTNDHPNGLVDTGAAYIVYGRTPVGNVLLSNLDDPVARPPTIRIRGEVAGDRIGARQTHGLDVNGDRVDDVFISSPTADFGGVIAGVCGDVDGNGVIDPDELEVALFNACRDSTGEEVFLDEQGRKQDCKAFDYDNDRDIDDDDRNVFDCLVAGFSGCCPVDNGFVGVIFGNVSLDGDRDISQIATRDLPGIRFYGVSAGDRAGADITSAGDFNRDGFGDLLIAAPGVVFTDANDRPRMGVAYLIFGGTHLNGNREFSLDQVGTESLPGIIFETPFVAGEPNEAPITYVGLLGDINADGFDDVGVGITRADFVDTALPQDPNDPGTVPSVGRRPDDGSVYIIYGNNTGPNR